MAPDAPDGTMVTAMIGDDEVSSSTEVMDGSYTLVLMGEASHEGQMVTFMIGDYMADETVTYMSRALDLDFDLGAMIGMMPESRRRDAHARGAADADARRNDAGGDRRAKEPDRVDRTAKG